MTGTPSPPMSNRTNQRKEIQDGDSSEVRLDVSRAREALDDAVRDILDVACGWSRSMTDAERLAAIRRIGEGAIRQFGVQVPLDV